MTYQKEQHTSASTRSNLFLFDKKNYDTKASTTPDQQGDGPQLGKK